MESLLRKRHDIEEGEESGFFRAEHQSSARYSHEHYRCPQVFLDRHRVHIALGRWYRYHEFMLISVSQRIREIGLRKAVGARPVHIITQFLIESSLVTLIGGIIGIVFGIFVAYLAALIIPRFDYEWEFLIPLSSVIIGFSVSFAIGLLFGLYPALKASRVSPMEALRYE